MHKVVIVGGGFGGIKAALNLAGDKRFDVKLVSSKPVFEYHAALYRSATGRSPLEVVVPLDDVFTKHANVEVIEDTATTIDPQKRTITSADDCTYHYDTAILALGAVTEYFGIKGLPEFSYGIKSIDEALELKRHLHEELTEHEMDSHFVVIGGGPTGVELAGELATYIKQLCRKHKVRKAFRVDLVEAAPRVLPVLPEDQSTRVQRRLRQLGIKLYTNTAVQGETVDALQLPEGTIKTHTVVWTAGVTNNPFFKANPEVFKLAKGNKVEVGPDLQAVDNVYVIGDSAFTPKAGWAQTAIYDASYVTANLKRELRDKPPLPYQPHQPIGAIPVGPKWAAVSAGKLRLYGRAGWWIRRLADLRLYLSFMPVLKAISVWLYGNKVEESCPICAKR